MKANRIVLIDDDKEIRFQLGLYLNTHSFNVQSFASAEDFLLDSAPMSRQPAIFLIDLNLPGMNGMEVAQFIRRSNPISPVFIISGEIEPAVISKAFASGADDFIQKPYTLEHLGQKVVNARKKLEFTLSGMFNYGVKVIPESSLVCSGGKRIKLTPIESKIVELLISNGEKIFSRDEIVSHLCEGERSGRNIDVHVVNIRKKITELDLVVETIRGQGYRIRQPTKVFG